MGTKRLKTEKKNVNKNVTLKTLLAMTMADIDIFLLQNKEQTEDLNKTFSTEEIRNQLHETLKKTVRVLEESGIDVDKPLYIDHINF